MSAELDWQPIGAGDLARLGELIRAGEDCDRPRERLSLEALAEDLTSSGADPARDTRILTDADGTAVAYGWNYPQHADETLRRVLMTGVVHPDRRRAGIGHQLMSWQLAAAREWDAETRRPEHGPLRYLARFDREQLAAQRLAEDLGLPASRWFAFLTHHFSTTPPAPADVPGVDLVALTPDLVDGARLAHNAAIADHWGGQPLAADQWREELASLRCRPSWCLAAVDRDSGEVVGYAINAVYEDEWESLGYSEGQTDRLGVRREWRHRGIASALLRRSMEIFHAAGLQAAGLGVDSDNPTGAFRLYRQLGYEVAGGFVVHTRTEPEHEG